MEPLSAALVAGLVAWISIIFVVALPRVPFDLPGLRRVGAATIATIALQILGAPLPAGAPLFVLAGGVIAVYQTRGAAAA